MKLDEKLIKKIVDRIYEQALNYDSMWVEWQQSILDNLKELDLVIKPGDSSQSILVENK